LQFVVGVDMRHEAPVRRAKEVARWHDRIGIGAQTVRGKAAQDFNAACPADPTRMA
jgi:hypothetical protein